MVRPLWADFPLNFGSKLQPSKCLRRMPHHRMQCPTINPPRVRPTWGGGGSGPQVSFDQYTVYTPEQGCVRPAVGATQPGCATDLELGVALPVRSGCQESPKPGTRGFLADEVLAKDPFCSLLSVCLYSASRSCFGSLASALLLPVPCSSSCSCSTPPSLDPTPPLG